MLFLGPLPKGSFMRGIVLQYGDFNRQIPVLILQVPGVLPLEGIRMLSWNHDLFS